MDRRFANIFGLTEEQAISLLKTSSDRLEDRCDRYVGASHLANFPTERSIRALIETLRDPNPATYHRIARRKAVESLGRLKAAEALPAIRACLVDEDCYTVENAVWSLGEIGTEDETIHEEIARLLARPGQNYRSIIRVLSKFNYKNALERVERLTESEDETVASAAISAIARLAGDYSGMNRVVELLSHANVNVRRACVQDLIDARYYDAIPHIARCPVSIVFRLRGIRSLANAGIGEGSITFAQIEPDLDRVVRDRPGDLNMVHEYDRTPSLEFAIGELYQTDFGRCYLASQTLLDVYPDRAAAASIETFEEKAHHDYGAHYHVIKLLGWLGGGDAYDFFVQQGLHNKAPQFQKSRAAAAIALGELGDRRAVPLLQECLSTPIFHLKYACLMALEQLGDTLGPEMAAGDEDRLIRLKARARA
ncbi:HEAT repeat domain-containing protein [Oscillatoriales cyanobacterium LEGE 11467]|uniref:HEAT repeat domain-containing protein n=1 Tax=Zarconia navalis LEGE 11467 TaxID=1828826 RepID=A0A928VUC4_9CYAN|nr:HEAT repeat domain-containing protein [Zarconia navalis]MBE9039599.1 HEAT repeat domain-containing protein [Zarconia navalis LEGE 11467]